MDSQPRDARPLLRRAPTLPWIGLATLPTPLVRSSLFGRNIQVKSDAHSGALYGGNKVRKLEFAFAEALESGANRVLTVGAAGSNHALATARYAQALGLACDVLHFPQPSSDHVRRTIEAIHQTGARLSYVTEQTKLPLALARARSEAILPGSDKHAFYIPGGGSSPRGSLGYVNAALELLEHDGAMPDHIYVAAGTGGTMAGLVVGLALGGRPDIHVHGIRVIDRVICNKPIIKRLIRRICGELNACGIPTPSVLSSWTLHHDQFGDGYGKATKAGDDATKIASDHCDLVLEPTYTAKAFAAFVHAVQTSQSPLDTHLYWHTLNGHELPTPRSRVDDFAPPYRAFFGPTSERT